MIKAFISICSILRWHKKTFPAITCQDKQEKLAGEIREWEDALGDYICTGSRKNKLATEFELADVVIASINLMRFEEVRKRVSEKMIINRLRKWNGVQHKERAKK
jgi:hypothetical protein